MKEEFILLAAPSAISGQLNLFHRKGRKERKVGKNFNAEKRRDHGENGFLIQNQQERS
jgi:hypothetical protein